MLEKYPSQVRIAYKNFPLTSHQFARAAAIAATAAQRQGRFWELHDLLFANYRQLSDPRIKELAKEAGLDMARFERDVADPALAAVVEADLREGVAAGVRGTPTVFVNGRLLRQRDLQGFADMIDAELAKQGAK